MSNILVIGYLPPQLSAGRKIEAAHYRTGQFVQPLIAAGHTLTLAAVAEFDPGPQHQHVTQSPLPAEWQGRLKVERVDYSRNGWTGQLQRIHDALSPTAVVAVNNDCCLYATRLHTSAPLWMDIYGDTLTIQQASGYRRRSDRGMPTTIRFMQRILGRGDKFSGCSRTQCHMLVGELAMAGRLNWRTFGYEFTTPVLPGLLLEQQAAGEGGDDGSQQRAAAFRSQQGMAESNFVVLWAGGYNTWTDVDCLFSGLEAAMQQEERVHFVSVGASTYTGAENMYERFLAKIAASPLKERFHLLGWRPWSEMALYYSSANAGINIDALHYETIFGTRTRLMEMIAARLPILTTLGPELSNDLGSRGAALTFQTGDWQTLAKHILALAQNPQLGTQLAGRALEIAREEYSFAATTRTLRAWAAQPTHAPDWNTNESFRQFGNRGRAALRLLLWDIFGQSK